MQRQTLTMCRIRIVLAWRRAAGMIRRLLSGSAVESCIVLRGCGTNLELLAAHAASAVDGVQLLSNGRHE